MKKKRLDLVADVSQYQPHTAEFFKKLKKLGVKAVIIKATQGSTDGDHYVNPFFASQMGAAYDAGLITHYYHYARFLSSADAVHEAKWFIHNLKKYKANKQAVAVVDIEDACLPKRDLTKATQIFMDYVKAGGYHRTDIYAMASWFWNRRLDRTRMRGYNVWVANYGSSEPGVDNVGTWQFTDNYHGLKCDMSYDFNGYYTRNYHHRKLRKL